MGKVSTLGAYIYHAKHAFGFKLGNFTTYCKGVYHCCKNRSPACWEDFRWALFGIMTACPSTSCPHVVVCSLIVLSCVLPAVSRCLVFIQQSTTETSVSRGSECENRIVLCCIVQWFRGLLVLITIWSRHSITRHVINERHGSSFRTWNSNYVSTLHRTASLTESDWPLLCHAEGIFQLAQMDDSLELPQKLLKFRQVHDLPNIPSRAHAVYV